MGDTLDRPTELLGPGREGHLLLAVDRAGQGALFARFERVLPSEESGSYRHAFQAVLARPGQLPLVISDDAARTTNDRWETRTTGLWTEAVCEERGRRWSYGLEAFAVGIDNPNELLGQGYGHREPLGWELDFDGTDRPSHSKPGQFPPPEPQPQLWEQRGVADGLVQLQPGAEADVSFSGPAIRRHWVVPSGADWHPEADWRPDLPGLAVAKPGSLRIGLPLWPSEDDTPIWWIDPTADGWACEFVA